MPITRYDSYTYKQKILSGFSETLSGKSYAQTHRLPPFITTSR